VASGGQWWWSGSLGCRGRRQVQVWSSPGLVALSCSLTLLLGPLCATGVIWCSGLECWSGWGWGSDGVFPRRWLWSNASPWRHLALVASEVEVVLATLIWQWLSSSPLRTGMAGFLKQRVKVLPGSLCQHRQYRRSPSAVFLVGGIVVLLLALGGPPSENSSPDFRVDGGVILMSFSPWRHRLGGPRVPTCLWLMWVAVTVLASAVGPPLQKFLRLLGATPSHAAPLVVASLGVCVCWSSRFGVLAMVRCFFSRSSVSSVVAAPAAWVAMFSQAKFLLSFDLCL
jgi:hypothetical protein